MANTGKKKSADLRKTVEGRLRSAVRPGEHVVVGLSGGVDSVTLLSIVVSVRKALGISVTAVHVNHGLSPNAEKWAEFCRDLCSTLDVPVVVERADLGPWRSMGLEGAAREARYEILRRHRSDAILLGHHLNDQAETLIVQLLRGAGAAGLAGMAEADDGKAKVIRPLLRVTRSVIEDFAKAEGLSWVEDESNADLDRPRNLIRHGILPMLDREFPGVAGRIARSASHLAEAAHLIRELGRLDLQACEQDGALSISRLQDLGELRARNVIRFWSESHGFPPAPTSASLELWRQLLNSRPDSSPEVMVGGACYRRYRDSLYIERPLQTKRESVSRLWTGAPSVDLGEFGGSLLFTPIHGAGLSAAKLYSKTITVRTRRGGERLRPDIRRPTRSLKSLLQQNGVPVWKRHSLPLIFCDEALVSVPGIADDCMWIAGKDEPGIVLVWKEKFSASP